MMKICLISVEIFSWGKYGGFGRSTRMIGRELVRQGIDVFAVVPRRSGQRPVERLDGMTVLGFPYWNPWAAGDLYRECNADIYHSQEPSYGTVLAMNAMPGCKHIITFRDPKDRMDRTIEMRYPSQSRIRTFLASLYENAVVTQSVRRADRIYCCAPHIGRKVRDMFGLESVPEFLPSPIEIPERPMKKAFRPTIAFIARWDRRKRPERFFELAVRFPDWRFVAVGKSQDAAYEDRLRRRFSNVPNLELRGFINQFETDELSKILEESWVLVNTSVREGLPTAFLEALAHECALLSAVNPDGMAERFGIHVTDGDFAAGLRGLIGDHSWREKGLAGSRYVRETYNLKSAVERHLAVYDDVLGRTADQGIGIHAAI